MRRLLLLPILALILISGCVRTYRHEHVSRTDSTFGFGGATTTQHSAGAEREWWSPWPLAPSFVKP